MWDILSHSVQLLLSTKNNLWVQSWGLGRIRSHKQHDLENTVARALLEYSLPKNCCTVKDLWRGILLWCRIQLLLHFLSLFCQMAPSNTSELWYKKQCASCPRYQEQQSAHPAETLWSALYYLRVTHRCTTHKTDVSSHDHKLRLDSSPVIILDRWSASCIDHTKS